MKLGKLSTELPGETEPVKLKLMYQINNTNTFVDLPNYNYNSTFFPGKPDSKLTIQIPKDIDNDNIFNENIHFGDIGTWVIGT